MGKILLNNQQPPSPPTVNSPIQVKSTLLPELSRKEWTAVLIAVFIILSIGFTLGFVVNLKKLNDASHIISTVDPLITIEKDLNDKLKLSSKQMDKIDDDDLYKVVMESKSKKIESIKEQLKDIETFRSNHINSINLYYNNKKDELKKKEILYHR